MYSYIYIYVYQNTIHSMYIHIYANYTIVIAYIPTVFHKTGL